MRSEKHKAPGAAATDSRRVTRQNKSLAHDCDSGRHDPASGYVLPDRLRQGLKLVFCGTAAGRQSALQGAYYAHAQNRFWKTLYEVGLTPRLYAPAEYAQLWSMGIGLTDIAKFAYGMDHQLPKEALGEKAARALRARITRAAPRHLAFTSLRAGRTIMGSKVRAGEQSERLGATRVWVLPSPSPLAANHFDIAPWRALADAVLADGKMAES